MRGGAGRHAQARDQRGDERCADHAQILHDGDEAHVRTIGFRHQRHHGGRTRHRAPDRGGAGKHAPAHQQGAEQGCGRHHRHHAAGEHRPVPHDLDAERGRQDACDHAAEHGLGGDEQRRRHAQRGAGAGEDGGGGHGPQQQRRRKPQGLQRRHQQRRQREQQQGLDRTRPAIRRGRPDHAVCAKSISVAWTTRATRGSTWATANSCASVETLLQASSATMTW